MALTLRTAGRAEHAGEIARAFLVPETTLAQRLVRAKRKIREAGIPTRPRPAQVLDARIAGGGPGGDLPRIQRAYAGDPPSLVGEAIGLARRLNGAVPGAGALSRVCWR